jgi:carbon catabolite-derepressing protein kinase
MNLQLYMVDSINYLVDFTHKSSYKASTDPAAGKFDMATPDPPPGVTCSESVRSSTSKEMGAPFREDEVVSPFVFMDVACRLILELAGSAE